LLRGSYGELVPVEFGIKTVNVDKLADMYTVLTTVEIKGRYAT